MTAVSPTPVGLRPLPSNGSDPDLPRGVISAADLVESMMGRYGHRVPLDAIARAVHDALHDLGHPGGTAVPPDLRRRVVRRVRAEMYIADPGLRPARSDRAESIVRALAGGRR